MSHKVHPKAYRIKEIADWDSRGFYRNPAEYLEEDFKIRKFLLEKLVRASVEKIEIERFSDKLNIIISTARPGIVIGRGGEGVEQLKKVLERKILKKETLANRYESFSKDILKKKKTDKGEIENKESKQKEEVRTRLRQNLVSSSRSEIRIEIREIKNPWTSAALVAQWIAQQIEKRVPFRKVLKQALSKVGAYKEIQGVKIKVSGRLNGNEIARTEWMKNGRLPLQTIRANIDYAKYEAHCAYGTTGIKVWLYKGEKFK